MNTYKHFIGIDVSKEKLYIFILPESTSFSLCNERKGIETLMRKLKKRQSSLIVLKASGGYEGALLCALHKNQFSLKK